MCHEAKGKRSCALRANESICPPCCARNRGPECEGCGYYAAGQQNLAHKTRKQKEKPFTAEIVPEVDAEVDRALGALSGGREREAELLISGLFERRPDLHIVNFAMGTLRAMQGRHVEALAHFTRAVEIFPYFAEAWCNKGTAHRELLQVSDCIRSYQKVVEHGDPDEDYVQNARRLLGSLERTIRAHDGISLEDYLKSMNAFDAAVAEMQAGRVQAAIDSFKRALMFAPRHHQSHGNLGICYAALGMKREALASLDRALELEPRYEPAAVARFVVEHLTDGEKLDLSDTPSIDYSSDYQMTGRSLIRELAERLPPH
jgi:tetratricopeptide (TPR) repeat protein